jgi:cytosine permease
MASLLELLNEDSALEPVMAARRQNLWFLASVMIGCTICVPVFVMGANLAHSIPLKSFILACLLGGSLAALVAMLTGIVGQRTGLPTAMLAKIAFGTHGQVIANLSMALGSIGWFGIQTSVFSRAFVDLSAQVWDIPLNLTMVTILAGLVMSTTAIIGFRGLGKLSYVAVPLLIVLLALPLYVYFIQGRLSHLPTVTQNMGFGTMVAMIAGAYSFSATMPDVTRFMRDGRSTLFGIVVNFVFAYPGLLMLTGVVALASGQMDYMQIMLGLGYGSLAIVVLFLATWTTNDANVYTGALSVNIFLPSRPRWQIAAAVGVVGTLFAVMGLFEHFMTWLIFTGNLFAPMAGAYVADYWLDPARYSATYKMERWRPRALLAWAAGFAIGVATTSPDNMGLGWFMLTGIPMFDALIVAAVVRYLAQILVKKVI